MKENFKGILAMLLALSMVIPTAGLSTFATQTTKKEQQNNAAAKERKQSKEKLGYVPGEMLVVYKDKVSDTAIEKIADKQDAEIQETIDTEGKYTVAKAEISENDTVSQAVDKIEDNDKVEYAQPNYVYTSDEKDKIEKVEKFEKGDTYTVDGRKYLVLGVNEKTGTAKLMEKTNHSMIANNQTPKVSDEIGNVAKYAGSMLDNYLEDDYYNGLPESLKSNIVPEKVEQKTYTTSTGAKTGQTYTTVYNNGKNYANLKYRGKANIGERHCYAPSVEDLINYTGKNKMTSAEQKSFFWGDQTTAGIWLRDVGHSSAKYILQSNSNYVYSNCIITDNKRCVDAVFTVNYVKFLKSETTKKVSDFANDSDITKQYYLNIVNAVSTWAGMDKVEHERVKVAVIDSGVDFTHEELQGAINEDLSVSIEEDGTVNKAGKKEYTAEHGTHVAGIIAGKSNNEKGIAGVGAGLNNDIVDLVSIKATIENGTYTTTTIMSALNYCVEKKIRIANMSFGGSAGKEGDALLEEAIEIASDNGVTAICAASNDRAECREYPASADEAIGVIATKKNGTDKADFSNYGGKKNKISAPGTGIYSTLPDNKYTDKNGTSMATPIVTGVAAMILSVNPDLSTDELKETLLNTTTDIQEKGYDEKTGYGLVNAEQAVEKACEKAGKEIKFPTIEKESIIEDIAKDDDNDSDSEELEKTIDSKENGKTLSEDDLYEVKGKKRLLYIERSSKIDEFKKSVNMRKKIFNLDDENIKAYHELDQDDDKISLNEFEKMIRETFKDNTENDLSYISLGGHGNDLGLFLLEGGTIPVSPSKLRTLLDQYVKGKVILLIRACYSGIYINKETDNFAEDFVSDFLGGGMSNLAEDFSDGGHGKYKVLCSASKNEEAYVGFFGSYLGSAMGWDNSSSCFREDYLADHNGDDMITFAELVYYLKHSTYYTNCGGTIAALPEKDNIVIGKDYHRCKVVLKTDSGKSDGSARILKNSSKFGRLTPPVYSGHRVEGYYTKEGTKVANADGTLVNGTVPGYTTKGKWTPSEENTIKAKSEETIEKMLYTQWTDEKPSGTGWKLTVDGTLHITGTLNATGTGTSRVYGWQDYRHEIKKIVSENGAVAPEDASGIFAYCPNLTEVDLPNYVTKKTESCMWMFFGDNKLVNLGGLSTWDVSKVTSMHGMFYGSEKPMQLQDISELKDWDINQLESINSMFRNCGDIDYSSIKDWDVSNVTDMGYTFYRASDMDLKPLIKWNTRKVTNKASIFSCTRVPKDLQNEFLANDEVLTYDSNGSTATPPSSVTMTFRKSVTVESAISRDGYYFKEWNTKQDGTGTRYIPEKIFKDVNEAPVETTLYAQWTVNPEPVKSTIVKIEIAPNKVVDFIVIDANKTNDGKPGMFLVAKGKQGNTTFATKCVKDGKVDWEKVCWEETEARNEWCKKYYEGMSEKIKGVILPSNAVKKFGENEKDQKDKGKLNNDKVFFLSKDEIECLDKDEKILVKNAKSGNKDAMWWFRDCKSATSSYVDVNGNYGIYYNACHECNNFAARPAMNIDKEKVDFEAIKAGICYKCKPVNAKVISGTNKAQKGFDTVNEAIEAAKPGDTVKLYTSLKNKTTPVIGKGITLDANGYDLGCVQPGNIPEGETLVITNSAEKEGVELEAWIDDNNCTGKIAIDEGKYNTLGKDGRNGHQMTIYGGRHTIYLFGTNNPSGSISYVKEESQLEVIKETFDLSKTETATLTYNANGHGTAPSPVTMKYTTETNAANAITATKYKFKGWNTKADGTGTNYAAGAVVKAVNTVPKAMTLYAQWTPTTYIIKFSANGGTGTMSDLKMSYDKPSLLPANTYTKEDYNFAGWAEESKTSVVKYDDEAVVRNLSSTDNAEKTLYAVWVEKKPYIDKNTSKQYLQVEYITTDGKSYIDTGIKTTQNHGIESKYRYSELKNTSARIMGSRQGSGGTGTSGYIASWSGNGINSTFYIAAYGKYTTNTFNKLDKKWHTVKTDPVTREATFDGKVIFIGNNTAYSHANGYQLFHCYNGSTWYYGSSICQISSFKMHEGNKMILNMVPVKEVGTSTYGMFDKINNKFYGNAGNGSLKGGSVCSSKYEYEIKYCDANSTTFTGTLASGSPTKHTYGVTTQLENPTKTGYAFGGWFTTKDCSGTAVKSLGETAYTKNITLYADWYRTEFLSDYDGAKVHGKMCNGWTKVWRAIQKGTNSFGLTSGFIPKATDVCYVFDGFYTGKNGTGTKYFDKNFQMIRQWDKDVDTTLYAYYVRDTYEETVEISAGRSVITKKITKEYERVEYVESSGTQYINTGVAPDNTTIWEQEIKYMNISNQNQQGITSSEYKNRFENGGQYQGRWIGAYASTNKSTQAGKADTEKHKWILDANKKKITCDGKDMIIRLPGGITQSQPIYLMARYSGERIDVKASCRLYSVKLTKKGEVVRDFVPVKNKTTGEYGLFDRVKNKFYGNAGSGDFAGN